MGNSSGLAAVGGAVLAVAFAAACGSSSPATGSTASQGSTGDASTSSGGTGGTEGTGGSSTEASTGSTSSGASVTYTADAQPIFKGKCSPCHTTGDDGTSNFASTYSDTQAKPNLNVAPECSNVSTVGACTIIRIKNGAMPLGAGCSGDPTTDADNSACLTADEQDTIQAWISDGEKE